ncbi:MAG: DUF2155 domain-containing protein [Nitrospirota bacterium]
MKRIVAAVLVAGLLVSFAGCKKKEEKPQLPPGHPSTEGGMPPAGMPDMPKVDRKVVVPKEIAAKWKAVKLAVEDKTKKATKEYTINVGSSLDVPGTKVKLTVLSFLPDFRMGDKDITSASDKPNNPAAQILIQEPGKPEQKIWLYSMHPGVHPFQHEKIGLVLNGGVSK